MYKRLYVRETACVRARVCESLIGTVLRETVKDAVYAFVRGRGERVLVGV